MVALDLDLKVIFLPGSFGAPGLITCTMFLLGMHMHLHTIVHNSVNFFLRPSVWMFLEIIRDRSEFMTLGA